ncbi:hypothetical protein CVT25_000482 [Psilocybe cyanescens]|uniref:Uncharacterized protein n=1 Tax=Psilocybe cyanescens TaxID=93625 RepID=A0A409XW89_PSICY|nr:hypothetical protein CVT25_000482 [Psilocybe cyanescens]
MMGTISELLRSIGVWNDVLSRLGEHIEEENRKVAKTHKERMELVSKAMKKIEVNAPHDEVTRRRTNPDQRVSDFVLHSEKIEVSVEPHGCTKDWALIELYDEKVYWSTFKWNKVRGNISIADVGNTLTPQPVDQASYRYPQDSLLQVHGVMQNAENCDPQHGTADGLKLFTHITISVMTPVASRTTP